MIYPDTDPDKFAIKHGLPRCSQKCRNCGIEVDVNVPFISRNFVGFESRIHECGPEFKISYAKMRNQTKALDE